MSMDMDMSLRRYMYLCGLYGIHDGVQYMLSYLGNLHTHPHSLEISRPFCA